MAVTSLWRITGDLNKVIIYATDDNKTFFSEEINLSSEQNSEDKVLEKVIDYTQRDSATNAKRLISGINCDPDNAAKEMKKIKNKFGKTSGIIAFHGYQSFKEDEIDADTAHLIGCKLAEELWKDFQVIVCTHIDKDSHIHNHFVINTVSFVNGKKFRRTKKDYADMRDVSDRLCKEYSLSVINFPERTSKKYYNEYMAGKNGELTKNGIIKRDIDECILLAPNEKIFYREMAKRGYTFDFSHKYATISHPDFVKARRLKTLGDEYLPDIIVRRIYGTWKSKEELEIPEQDDVEDLFFNGDMHNNKIFDNYQTVYFHLVFGIGVVKERGNYNRELQRLLGDELIKFDKWSEENDLIFNNNLKTESDVLKFINVNKVEIQELSESRKKLQAQLQKAVRAEDIDKQEKTKKDISILSERIKSLNKNIKISNRVLEKEPLAENKLKEIREYSESKRKERDNDEYIKRSSRPGRENNS